MNVILIAIGGAAGSLLRYSISLLLNKPGFPFGTLAVNIIGSLLVGIFWAYFIKADNEGRRLLLITGFCGGFTTFSTFSFEGLTMLQQAKYFLFFLYTAASIIFGLTATYIGFKLFHT